MIFLLLLFFPTPIYKKKGADSKWLISGKDEAKAITNAGRENQSLCRLNMAFVCFVKKAPDGFSRSNTSSTALKARPLCFFAQALGDGGTLHQQERKY